MSQDNTPQPSQEAVETIRDGDVKKKPEAPKAERPKIVGFIKVVVSVCIPRTDYPQVSSQADCEPLIFNIFPQTRNPKELPDGILKTTRQVLGEMVELIREFQHPPLSEEQRLQLAGLEKVQKPKGRPNAQVFARNPVTGETRPVGKPLFLDAQGNEMHNEKP